MVCKKKNINTALNYGYAIIRGMIARSICASGLHAAFGIFHCNQLNAFNLVDDMIEPYRIFVDSVVWQMYHDCMLNVELQKAQRVQLAEILSASVLLLDGKTYPLYRAVISSVQSLVQNMIAETELNLPVFDKEKSNGREVYESTSDV